MRSTATCASSKAYRGHGALITTGAVAALTSAAAAQTPVFSVPLERPQSSEIYRHLPVRESGAEIRVEVNADLLYSLEDGKVRASASDLLGQAANLIYERARSPVRIECRSDRMPAAAAQSSPTPAPLMQYLVKEEKVTNVKFARRERAAAGAARSARSVCAAAAAAEPGADRVREEVRGLLTPLAPAKAGTQPTPGFPHTRE